MCKRIGAVDKMNDGKMSIKCLEGLSDQDCAKTVAQHMTAISNEYEPVDLAALAAFLPSCL